MFKVGDIIVGTEEATRQYVVTTSWATLEVIKATHRSPFKGPNAIGVRLIGHKDNTMKHRIGDEFLVDGSRFVLDIIDNRRIGA